MKKLKNLLFVAALFFTIAKPALSQKALRCEYLENPIGLDTPMPRITWQLDDDRQGAEQTAFRVTVNKDSIALKNNLDLIWDTGKTFGDRQMITYGGEELEPFTTYFWAVETWDKDGKSLGLSKVASFETGMMKVKNWQGAWISDGQGKEVKPAPYFRKSFNASKKIKKARAYIAVGGLYELSINGQRIGNHQLDPVYTRFDRRLLYVTHDVTNALQEGENAIGVLLGNGWYNHQSTAVWFFDKAPWRNRPTFCMDLRITYEDGTVETIATGKEWKTDLSPLIFNSIYTAEHYDARLQQPGWDKPGFDDSQWKGVIYRSAPAQNITAQAMPPIRHNVEIAAKSVNKINDSTYVFDLGRNIAGVSEIRVKGEAGTEIRLKHGERLADNGRVDMSNIDVHYRPTDDSDPFQTDIFILKGEGEETFVPKFNYKGFQYVEVTSNQPLVLSKESLKGYFMHSDVSKVGMVKSSNPTLDAIWSATNNAYLSNLFGYPTDCPQREKNGWTGDAHIAIETGLYSFDGIKVYEKWMDDHRDEQQPNGVLPSIIPTSGWGYEWGNGPDWTSTICLIPWNIYLFYGDQRVLEENYEAMKKYVDHITEISPSGLTTWGLGDWVPVKSKSPVEFTSSAYYYVDANILAKVAALLGHDDEAEQYSALSKKIKNTVNDKYLNKETGIYGSGYQTELSVALHWGLVPDDMKELVAKNLAERVAADNFHLDVGLLGTKSILNALSENGYANEAYQIAAQETYPSWGWWIVNGATTLYENWDIESQNDISLNHIMFGEIGAWIYKGLGGIKPDPNNPGFRNVLLEPHFVKGLEEFEATHQGPYGEIRSSWKKTKKGMVSYMIEIPANSTASLILPISAKFKANTQFKQTKDESGSKVVYELSSGSYELEIEP
ncbi:family 78 glycoside hydrolase catalytic domain [Echinicola sp. CAU 1574]|uniref:alpha-L-rhamnosidase n=1 Tax=Echinicola arenosa TaxID=2774144 RepID=A0ABR9AM81_9BACT|nr:alpha-L-rhamnosidase [Echinicola arenosa]MBD8489913.1 family 78 glycoside hydrolase catalytic domain [Echinicola arenosa]